MGPFDDIKKFRGKNAEKQQNQTFELSSNEKSFKDYGSQNSLIAPEITF